MAKAPYHRGEELFVVLNMIKGIPFSEKPIGFSTLLKSMVKEQEIHIK